MNIILLNKSATHVLIIFVLLLVGCNDTSKIGSQKPGIPTIPTEEWHTKAAEEISVELISVVWKPGPSLLWTNERSSLRLTEDEKQVLRNSGVSGEFEVLGVAQRGSAPKKVRVVIVLKRPIEGTSSLTVPRNGSAVYLQDEAGLSLMETNIQPSSLVVEVKGETEMTSYTLDYPRDGTRYGGYLFVWDENGNPREI